MVARFLPDGVSGKPTLTPMIPGLKLTRDAQAIRTPTGPSEALTFPYAQALGSVMYAMVNTRPDIAFAVGSLAQFMHEPQEIHVASMIHLLKYLHYTAHKGLRLGLASSAQEDETTLTGYADADWASSPIDRKSVSGWVFLLNGAAISWSSKKQHIVACSSTEAEYISLASASREAIWLRSFLEELHYPITLPTTIYGDNKAALQLAENPIHHQRTKHIDISHHVLRQYTELNLIAPTFIPGSEQTADFMTKSLPSIPFDKHVSKLMVGVPPS